MKTFKTYHPLVNLIYFLLIISFSAIFMNPVCLLISITSSFVYLVILRGRKAVRFGYIYLLPVLIGAALINPVFNHEGVTVLGYLKSGNPITLESILYGIAASVMLGSVICWFSCFNEIMTSDRLVYLFGKIIPSFSLVLSMTLRFIPRFKSRLKAIFKAQKCIGRTQTRGSIIKRAKSGINILSVMITWSLEDAVETADSMKSRGYGLPGRTAFSIFEFTKRDAVALIIIALLALYTLTGKLMGYINFTYFPKTGGALNSVNAITVFTAYIFLCFVPTIIEIREVYRWKYLKSKI